MKVTANIFWIIGVFFVIMGLVYGFLVEWTEWAGIPAILALGAMSFMIAWYIQATEKRFGQGPADDEDGEITVYTGTYGVFAPWSWWPLLLGTACAITVTGLAVGWWIFFIGVAVAAFATVGWVYEFSKGKYAH